MEQTARWSAREVAGDPPAVSQKDPKARRRDIGDVRLEIERGRSESARRTSPPVQGSRRSARLAWAAAGVLAAALAAAMVRPFVTPTLPRDAARR